MNELAEPDKAWLRPTTALFAPLVRGLWGKAGRWVDRDEAATSRCKWFPYNKGGEFRKWYGNQE